MHSYDVRLVRTSTIIEVPNRISFTKKLNTTHFLSWSAGYCQVGGRERIWKNRKFVKFFCVCANRQRGRFYWTLKKETKTVWTVELYIVHKDKGGLLYSGLCYRALLCRGRGWLKKKCWPSRYAVSQERN